MLSYAGKSSGRDNRLLNAGTIGSGANQGDRKGQRNMSRLLDKWREFEGKIVLLLAAENKRNRGLTVERVAVGVVQQQSVRVDDDEQWHELVRAAGHLFVHDHEHIEQRQL